MEEGFNMNRPFFCLDQVSFYWLSPMYVSLQCKQWPELDQSFLSIGSLNKLSSQLTVLVISKSRQK